jgi:HK97 family phage major capsid protein
VKLSSEVIDDSSPSVLDVVGTRMVAAVALAADHAILAGKGGKEPTGIYGQALQHVVSATITINSLVEAAGLIGGVGGAARAAYVNGADHTLLMKETDKNGRPSRQVGLRGQRSPRPGIGRLDHDRRGESEMSADDQSATKARDPSGSRM